MATAAESRDMRPEMLRRAIAAYDVLRFRTPRQSLRFHAHCHQQAIAGTRDASALLSHVWGDSATTLDAGCCGMAGAFGHELEHYDVARAIGEDRLFPAVRDRGEAAIAVSGFSCRHQIAHHTGVTPRHLVEHLADLLE